MPRRKKLRHCRGLSGYNLFKPSGIPLAQIDVIELGLDELEAMLLCDLEDRQQGDAAEVMGVSRGTIQRLLQSGRKKVLRAISEGDALSFADADHVCIRPRRGGGRHGAGHGRWKAPAAPREPRMPSDGG